MQERPRFRTDLVAKPVSDAGQRFVDVTDPDSGSTFRFYEVEYAVACAMNGKRDFGGLVQWSQAELGLEPSRQELETVVSTLDELGYLAAGQDDSFALGQAGRSPIAEPRSVPTSDAEFELGHAGPRGDTATEDTVIEADVPEGSDVSVDLSQHLSIGADDVKEAVRQSRVMGAVEAPSGFDDDEADEAETAVKEEPIPRPAEVAQSAEDAVAAEVRKEVKKEAGSSGAKPITIPAKAPSVKVPSPAEKAAAALPKPEQTPTPSGGGAMTFVLIILLLGVLGVGGWFVYTNFLQKPADGSSEQLQPVDQPTKTDPVKKKKSYRVI